MSESEEMYLVTIARLKETGQGLPIPLSQLAGELDVAPVSANQMIRKLEETGWVCYTPYKGVELTRQGEHLAMQILRHRRLWEVFLIENLRISAKEACEIACRLEHAMPTDAADRLSDFLGNPTVTPLGLPIPPSPVAVEPGSYPLNGLGVNEAGVIIHLNDDPAVRAFLLSEGLLPGITITVVAISSSGSVLLSSGSGHVQLSATLSHGLWVTRVNEKAEEPNL
jgi:DtxR family transcriptional regulator, Mn-dependent transcriptional regulator